MLFGWLLLQLLTFERVSIRFMHRWNRRSDWIGPTLITVDVVVVVGYQSTSRKLTYIVGLEKWIKVGSL